MQDRHVARLSLFAFSLTLQAMFVSHSLASDWDRFRGPNGSGVSPDAAKTPTTWTDTENVKWSIELPGPGSSCPIVVGDKVFVTCWSGYGLDRNVPGDQADLKRHLVCVNRQNGNVLWDQVIDPYLPEDEYGGMFAEHGYASHTPASDGEQVYAFFGKTGVVAFDMSGKKLWQTSLGTESGIQDWGTASSPLLYKDLVIVPATAENRSLVALDKKTGSEVWKQEADGFEGTWSSPILVDLPGGDQEIVLGVPGEIWAFNPTNGKLKWYAKGPGSTSITSSVVTADADRLRPREDAMAIRLLLKRVARGMFPNPIFCGPAMIVAGSVLRWCMRAGFTGSAATLLPASRSKRENKSTKNDSKHRLRPRNRQQDLEVSPRRLHESELFIGCRRRWQAVLRYPCWGVLCPRSRP